MRKHTFKRVVLGATAMSMLFAGSAFTASNTGIDDHTAGVGSAAVSGIAVTNIAYNLDTTRETVNSLTFTSTETTTTMTAELSLDDGVSWTTCETVSLAGDPLVCNAPVDTALADVDKVTLVVTEGADVA